MFTRNNNRQKLSQYESNASINCYTMLYYHQNNTENNNDANILLFNCYYTYIDIHT